MTPFVRRFSAAEILPGFVRAVAAPTTKGAVQVVEEQKILVVWFPAAHTANRERIGLDLSNCFALTSP